MTFDQWWYDYCVKHGHHNPKQLREVAKAAWDAGVAQGAKELQGD